VDRLFSRSERKTRRLARLDENAGTGAAIVMPLGIGFVGSGFNARFHIQAFTGVRNADVRGVWSPNPKHAANTAELARSAEVGDAKAYRSIRDMVNDPAIDAIWLCGPNHARIQNVEEIVDAIADGAKLRGLACEKPLARNVAEAKKVARLASKVRLNTGYLENQLLAGGSSYGRAARR
jgi:predicted dehydrogenase